MNERIITLAIELTGYWHVGSGRGQGANADALVLKDRAGLPYLPGRSLKGLLREGLQSCEDAGLVPAGRTAELFGRETSPGKAGRSVPGILAVSNAGLPENEHAWLSSEKGSQSTAALYDTLASTKLDERGMADDKTLRTIELTVPVRLSATIRGPEGSWAEDLARSCALVRGLGAHRHRGLGRCLCTVHNEGVGHE